MRNIKKYLHSIGPGIITAALVFGPSKITITTMLGADYNYALLWVVVIAVFFMIIFTNMSARIGIATDKSLLTTIKDRWGKSAGWIIGLGVFLVTSSFQAGNSIGIGISVAETTGTSKILWIVLFNVLVIVFLFFRGFYKVLEKVMIGLIVLMLFSFIITLIFSKPSLSGIASGLIPEVPQGSLGLIIAFIASAFSMVGAFYQAYLIQERRKINPNDKLTGKESTLGICILGIMSAILLICAASVLNPKGIRIESASDMGRALEPAFGKYASYIFLLGLFAASFSSLLGNSTLGGTLLGDAVGFGNGGNLNSGKIRFIIAIIVSVGAVVAILFGKLPLQLIVFAQAITIFIVPFIGIAVYLIANDHAIMGKHCNNNYHKISGILGISILIFLAISNFYELFIK